MTGMYQKYQVWQNWGNEGLASCGHIDDLHKINWHVEGYFDRLPEAQTFCKELRERGYEAMVALHIALDGEET